MMCVAKNCAGDLFNYCPLSDLSRTSMCTRRRNEARGVLRKCNLSPFSNIRSHSILIQFVNLFRVSATQSIHSLSRCNYRVACGIRTWKRKCQWTDLFCSSSFSFQTRGATAEESRGLRARRAPRSPSPRAVERLLEEEAHLETRLG